MLIWKLIIIILQNKDYTVHNLKIKKVKIWKIYNFITILHLNIHSILYVNNNLLSNKMMFT